MPRFTRPPFAIGELDRLESEEAKTRLQFDWWCDDADRARYLDQLGGRLAWIRGRAHVQDIRRHCIPGPSGRAMPSWR